MKQHRYDVVVTSEPGQSEISVSPTKATSNTWLRPELVASWREIAAVLVLTTGYYAYSSAQVALYRWNGHTPHFLQTNYKALHLMAGESVILALFLLFLSWRGWKTADLKIKVGWWSTLHTLPLLVVDLMITFVGIYVIVRWNLSRPPHNALSPLGHATTSHVSWIVLVPSMVVNAYIEEVICMSYAFNQFAAKCGIPVALLFMLLLRISYHTWKSPAYLCLLVIGFAIYGLWYWRTRNVWPLILAHACFDLVLSIPQIR